MITTILQYSTIDIRFLSSNLEQLSKVSNEIIIPIFDHYFNGEPENEKLLNDSIEIISKYKKATAYTIEWQGYNNNPAYYHNLSRLLGTQIAKNDILFFVDADEIVDGDEFNVWLNTKYNKNYSYWLTCYWYFREPIYQSINAESAGLLIPKSYCNWNINIREERQQLFNTTPNFINGDYTPILSSNGTPMMNHYSWVRSKDDMIAKVKNWGHQHDKNWIQLVEEEFSRPFNGTDFVHGYTYKIVDNKFNL